MNTQFLIKARKDKDLTIEQAAKLLGFSCEELEGIEKGEIDPSASKVTLLSDFYGVSAKKLLGKKKEKRKLYFKIRKRKLIGFNRYGLDQGWSVIAIPALAFLGLCFLFVPSFNIASGAVSLTKLLFLTENVWHTVLGIVLMAVLGFNIFYWSLELTLGPYTRAKMKVLNNIFLSLFSILTFVVVLLAVLTFNKGILATGIITYILLFATALIQVVILILMNLDGGEYSEERVYVYHEVDYSGYERKHWFTLGVSVLALAALCLFFTIAYDGYYNIIHKINATMFEVIFKSSLIGVFIGGLAMAVLIFDIIYFVLVCTVGRKARRRMGKANNVLLVVMSIVLFVDSLAMISYFGTQYITIGGIFLYVLLFSTAVYGMCILPAINVNKRSFYVEDKKGLQKVRPVSGIKPGKIMGFKFSIWPQYLLVALLGGQIGISFLDPKISYLAWVGGGLIIFEIIFLILQRNKRYISREVFAFGMLLNTLIGLFNVFLLGYSLLSGLTLAAAISLSIVSGAIILLYFYMAYFSKPIRNAGEEI